MKFQAKALNLAKQKADCTVITVFEDKTLSPSAQLVDELSDGALSALLKSGDIVGKVGKTTTLFSLNGIATPKIIIVGAGKTEGLSPEDAKKLFSTIANNINTPTIKSVALYLDDLIINHRDQHWCAQHLAQAIAAASYRYDTTKSKKADKPALKSLLFNVPTAAVAKKVQPFLERGQSIGNGMNVTRELGNLPGNICTPAYLAKQARSMARGNPKLSVTILKEKEMRTLGMGALLSVSAGSEQEAHLIVMEYKGAAKSKPPHALVGKGITFDTGGISLKPGANMDEMKFDMCGAASVFGAMSAIVELEPAINVVAIIAASENMPSGRATKPGDVVTSMSGQTIEILNTDAEGRLVLCDALSYAEKFKPASVIDVATLTGACMVALGKHLSGLYSNDDDLGNTLFELSQQCGDKAWRMPMGEEFQAQLDSNFADMANIGGPFGGSVTAACFLARFTQSMTWAHLDVAGTAWHSGAKKGATGRPVPLLCEYLLSNAE
ncbi:leucyl aminopeptidase [Marinibactrum halimedae]|uniref:Probable cytosol aminopeptidase n=1 Tax=Marinibactrum halimedae TaxID=1444977 RepID=A0AA37T741_9GAMM|nr:leucyl aminopeptidase [Marinibactrum halimedae]MCD9457951.1 leucyl aminopeptidase [Marinibactrum halimedae]GLS26218.1 cytosol aminopeptidase [Marinibactrum halimedae]